ncbi:lysylphosphatidylglycerol synthase transmembrane domain-containing protein [Cecembia calidifontis]|uniref:Lysylphosphatidylglycerol synthase-like protein n=1 Tax=Cecembia calidifontis TaxID=1187080 RepID=A0A4Q7P4W2_9BACT|nr:lysylphosphatidylglycerol synthase transmembrane domain-containing protein [Cecembia calidifontis]RZS95053.1 hypothetical protein BC751_0568 [Cecembia calidifontis]
MRLNYKQWIQVVLSLVVAVWIFWFLYKDISLNSLKAALRETSFLWIGLSVIVSLLGYWIRAWRWGLLIEAGEKIKISTWSAFVALMIGYLANLLVPRAGEVARCGILAKTENQQMGKLLGTVILERTIDLLFMMVTIFLAFGLENQTFLSLIGDLVAWDGFFERVSKSMPMVLGGGLVAVLFFYFVFQKYRDSSILRKIRHFIRDMIQGFVSLRKVKNQTGFWLSSVMIWLIYYLMMLFVAWAIPTTASLSLSAVLIVMVMGSIGMVAPVQGGIGTFHALVAFILMAYGLSDEQGKIFAVIIHSSQVLTIILMGMITLGFFFKITAKKESKTY